MIGLEQEAITQVKIGDPSMAEDRALTDEEKKINRYKTHKGFTRTGKLHIPRRKRVRSPAK